MKEIFWRKIPCQTDTGIWVEVYEKRTWGEVVHFLPFVVLGWLVAIADWVYSE